MKKILFGIVAVMGFFMMWSCTESAPTLVGEWQIDSVMNDGGKMSFSHKLIIKDGGTVESSINASVEMSEEGMDFKFPFGLKYAGKWEADDANLTIDVDSTSIETVFIADSVKITSSDPEKQAVVDLMKGKMLKALEEQMKDPKGDFLNDFKTESDKYTYKLSNDELVLTSSKDNEPITYKRVK